ncbi:hypothetical protein evm_005507 [Chilo suppressalis]|nr:hypothetical protein evm_005507 [Chilo suppressalis]
MDHVRQERAKKVVVKGQSGFTDSDETRVNSQQVDAGGPSVLNPSCEQLIRFMQEVERKRPELINRRGVVFHHDKARHHISLATQQKLNEFDWEMLMYPPYSRGPCTFRFPPVSVSSKFRQCQELLPAEPWDDIRDAKAEGPVCPQTDVFYGRMKTASGGMSEACIHANIHVPIEALPDPNEPPSLHVEAAPGLPILVFIHGGGFAFGSGDTDLHGPEYLVSKGVIVITFNYRLNVFGFLSLNSTQVPGNAGLRDAVTLLRWVQRNARFFGGSPGSVTLAGQSAGAAMTHILTLSTSARSLFHRAILLSGTAFSDFFSSSPLFAKTINSLFLPLLGINATLPADEIHQKLIETPINEIMEANKKLINLFGLTTFTPVVESHQPGITPILEDDPEVLVDSGRGSEIPLLIGFTETECESFRPRFKQIDIVAQIEKTPELVVSPRLKFMTGDQLPVLAELMHNKYFNDTLDYDSFLRLCTDQYYKYPALKLASKSSGEAPVFMYRFSYDGVDSAWKEGLGLKFEGADHVEDLTYIFRTNSVLGPLRANELTRRDDDAKMKNKMTDIIVNFMRYRLAARPASFPPLRLSLHCDLL